MHKRGVKALSCPQSPTLRESRQHQLRLILPINQVIYEVLFEFLDDLHWTDMLIKIGKKQTAEAVMACFSKALQGTNHFVRKSQRRPR